MAVSNSSSAYDLSAFQAAPKKQSKPQLKVVGTPRRMLSTVFSLRVFSMFAIVLTLVSLIIYNQARLNELTGEMNELSDQMHIFESENVKMLSELESTISLHTVAERAKSELGMERATKYQTEYIYLYSQDKIERTEPSSDPDTAGETKSALQTLVGRLQEYIGS